MLTAIVVAALIGAAYWAYKNVQKVSARDLAEASSAGTKPQTFALARSAYVVAPALLSGLLERALQKGGFTVHRTGDVREASAFLLRNAVLVLIVDDASASVQEIVELRRLVPIAKVLIVTGNPLDAAHQQLMNATGAVAVLLRPFNEEAAASAISSAEAAAQRSIPS